MKQVITFFTIILFFAGCETEPEVNRNPDADWKIIDIQTDIDLHEVFFVNPNIGFVAGTAPYELVDHPNSSIVLSDYTKDVHIIKDVTPYYQRIIETVPSVPEPSFFKTLDGGATWENVSTPFVTTVTDIFFLDESYGFVATLDEGVYKTTNGGNTWEKVLANVMFMGRYRTLENPFAKIYFINKMEGFAFNDEKNVVVKTMNGGESWVLISSFVFEFGSTVEVQNMMFNGSTTIGYGFSISGGCCGRGELFKTENGGDTWTGIGYTIHNPPASNVALGYSPPKDFTFLDENIGFLTDGWNTYMTADGGISWERKNTNINIDGRTVSPEKISCLSEREVYILDGSVEEHNMLGERYELILNKCKVYYSSNSGIDYSEMSMQHNNASVKNWFFLDEVGFLVGEKGLILKHQRK